MARCHLRLQALRHTAARQHAIAIFNFYFLSLKFSFRFPPDSHGITRVISVTFKMSRALLIMKENLKDGVFYNILYSNLKFTKNVLVAA